MRLGRAIGPVPGLSGAQKRIPGTCIAVSLLAVVQLVVTALFLNEEGVTAAAPAYIPLPILCLMMGFSKRRDSDSDPVSITST